MLSILLLHLMIKENEFTELSSIFSSTVVWSLSIILLVFHRTTCVPTLIYLGEEIVLETNIEERSKMN